jgi:hypothetical protein
LESSLLLQRLDQIGSSLEQTGHALALIGLGSVGLELERLDAYSDLDFFVIVEPGHKHDFLDDLSWLSRIGPVSYTFANTNDGYKLLFADGIFCEFAVFEPDELWAIPFTAGRIIWKQPQVPETVSLPVIAPPSLVQHDPEWLLGEALTNVFVGLAREKRGEKLSAMRFIQVYAVERIIELADYMEAAQAEPQDIFARERRFEQRYPGLATFLPGCLQGYEHNRQSALAILSFLEQHFEVNSAIAAAIRELCD